MMPRVIAAMFAVITVLKKVNAASRGGCGRVESGCSPGSDGDASDVKPSLASPLSLCARQTGLGT
jgi:hypothetical protein